MVVKLTAEEEKAIASLKALARKWPKSLWLFSASGTLSIMKCGPGGKRMYCEARGGATGGGVDPAYHVDSADIPNDGGDW